VLSTILSIEDIRWFEMRCNKMQREL